MSYRTIPYSKLTNGVCVIERGFVDKAGNVLFPLLGGLHSGCLVSTQKVYSLCKGVVVDIRTVGLRKGVAIQYNNDLCFAYSNLTHLSVQLNQTVDASALVGSSIDDVLVECFQPTGPSTTWQSTIGAYTYYKQNPEPYIAGDIELLDNQATAFMSAGYPATFNYKLLSPYIVTLHPDAPQLVDWRALKSYRVSGAIAYAGELFDPISHARRGKFISPKLPRWIEDFQSAQLLHGYYFPGRARNRTEALDEIYELSYIVRNWPATLGVWVMPEFSTTVTTNNMILDTYRDALVELGLSGSIGIYTTREGLRQISWDSKQTDWLLWLVARCSSVSEFDTALTPDFFRL